MDGMIWFGSAEHQASLQQAADRHEVRQAFQQTAFCILAAIAFVMALSAAHVELPRAEEFSPSVVVE